jgi:hypothetical protein
MQGRVMSVLMFAAVALDPFSQGIAGFLADGGITLLYSAAGSFMMLVGALAFRFHPR